jgi:methylenetetrahydrofolate dehydrogenase (NADP+)/methenyltetrahydrofolate cyclohydrolase
MILDGKKTAQEIRAEIRDEIEKIKKERKPGLAVVLVGEDPASKVYVSSKIRTCREVGIASIEIKLDEDVTEEELLNIINNLNNDKTVDGILVQLPLPKHIDEKKVIETISVEKDVDGFNPEHLGNLFLGDDKGFKACTPFGIMELLNRYKIELEGKDVVIVGRSNIVGKPLIGLFLNAGATVTVCHSKTKNLKEKTAAADILVVAIGKAKFVTADMVKEGAVVVDVGINRTETGLCGDVDYENVLSKVEAITPVPGGVGPMTIAMLLKNTLNSYKRRGL